MIVLSAPSCINTQCAAAAVLASRQLQTQVQVRAILRVHCRADKYTCTGLDRLARDYLRRNFETVVKCDGRPPNRVGLVNLSQTALMQILTDDSLELSSEVTFT